MSGETFYVEYKRRLFRWKRGELEWFNTGLIDRVGVSDDIFKSLAEGRTDRRNNDLKLGVLGETVYVGKRDGHLFRSFDSGNTWKDLTSNLPLRFSHINDIVFAGLTVYVATNTGVLTSEDGEHWRVITDKTGANTIIDRIAMAGAAVYGVGGSGAHRLDNRGEWEKSRRRCQTRSSLPLLMVTGFMWVLKGAGCFTSRWTTKTNNIENTGGLS